MPYGGGGRASSFTAADTRFAPASLTTDSIWHDDDSNSDGGSSLAYNSVTTSTDRSASSSSKLKNDHSSSPSYCSIWNAKTVMLAIMLIAASSVAAVAHVFTQRDEESDFEVAFDMIAENMFSTIHLNSHAIQASFEAFAVNVASYAAAVSSLSNNASWPLVSIPNWQGQGTRLAEQTGSHQVAFVPLALEAERAIWEEYSVQAFDAGGEWQIDALPADFIWRVTSPTDATPTHEDRGPSPYYAPIWQTTTIISDGTNRIFEMINRNAYDMDYFGRAMSVMIQQRTSVQTEVLYVLKKDIATGTIETPVTALLTPIFDGNGAESSLVGVLIGWLELIHEFTELLPDNIEGIVLVVDTVKKCQEPFSLEINGPNVAFLGPGDHHNKDFDAIGVQSNFTTWTPTEECGYYTLTVYPSVEFQDSFQTKRPWVYTGTVMIAFFVASAGFLLYDWTVERRAEKVEARAARTDAIVNSLFPANVRDRLIAGDNNDIVDIAGGPGAVKNKKGGGAGDAALTNDFLLRDDVERPLVPSGRNDPGSSNNKAVSMHGTGTLETDDSGVFTTKPIADLFPACTVLFADIVGFTAWSSTREPSQVFTLLETTYNAFDKIAKRRRVFKVETIGDCYVAACGLPEPRKDHALVMARFANDCLVRMKEVVQRLEVSLGPDTAELGMRFGLHSGPVTAGVLRGEKSRFQLFGDTVNTSARIESTGECDKIHLSSETANQIKAFGKGHWIKKREHLVQAKGKGEIQTYWLVVGQQAIQAKRNASLTNSGKTESGTEHSRDAGSVVSASVQSAEMMARPIEQIAKRITDNRLQRLIGWNVDVLKRQLRQILAVRDPQTITPAMATIIDNSKQSEHDNGTNETEDSSHSGSSEGRSMEGFQIRIGNDTEEELGEGGMVLDEVKDIIQLPSEPAKNKTDPYHVDLSTEVVNQLTDYVTSIAQMYRDNPFHSFEHASHVTMSVCKLLSRVVTPQSINYEVMQVEEKRSEDLHQYTYGITSDPICQFACALSALIHDVDHPGVPNATLVAEQADVAKHYQNKSCAEQNSFDLAWGLLMEPQYAELRACIYATPEELKRFRQLLVNSVMATDIADRELGAQRKARWEKAFAADTAATPVNELSEEELLEDSNRKATIVIEHLIQASDVSHTMQHWHVYIKWNEKLFQEMYKAFLEGRAQQDPSENWYKSEIGFFDFYLIPLAKKLKECGVFGVASDEYLSYVTQNKTEWVQKGEEIVQGYVATYQEQYGSAIPGGGVILE